MGAVKLSILICTLPERSGVLARLEACFEKQKTNSVEFLTDDRENVPIGAKRNNLLDCATGEYIAFVDDDDLVSADYLDRVLPAIDQYSPDVIGIKGVILHQGNYPRFFIHSLQCPGWYTDEKRGVYYRTPNHLNPIRYEIAQAARFKNFVSFGEDQDYSGRIKRICRTEHFIDKPIYYYLYEREGISGTHNANL